MSSVVRLTQNKAVLPVDEIVVEIDAEARPTSQISVMRSLISATAPSERRISPSGNCVAAETAENAASSTYFSHLATWTSGLAVASTPPASCRLEDALDPRGRRVAGPLPEDDAARAARPDHAWRGHCREDVGRPAEHVPPADRLGDLGFVVDAVLERHDGRIRTDERPQTLRGRFRVVRLHAEQHRIHRPDFVGIVRRPKPVVLGPLGGLDRQAIPAEGVEMGASAIRSTWAPPRANPAP